MEISPVLAPNATSEVDPLEFVKDRIPEFTGENKFLKQQYLVFRVFDFPVTESAQMCHVNPRTIRDWRYKDQEFRDWEEKELPRLRRSLQTEITLSQFYRNMWLAMGIDAQILGKAWSMGLNALTKTEKEYLEKVRGRYSTESLHSMLKIATGDLTQDKSSLVISTVYIQGPRGEVIEPGSSVESGL